MGCDIHAYIEIKKAGWDTWWILAEVEIDRHYALFAKMAGVRNYNGITPVSEPRGIPEDAGYTVKGDHKDWEGDAHSGSWLTLEELKTVLGEVENDDLEGIIAMMEVHELKHGAKTRLVFWFDN